VERSYISYGKKSISIKLSNAKVRDAVILASLEHRYETEGVTKKVSNQGVIYTFK
jgi:hypothetical protein